MDAFEVVSWACLVIGLVFVPALLFLAYYSAKRAERRRRENAEPDLLDVLDAVMMSAADFAPREVKTRYRNMHD